MTEHTPYDQATLKSVASVLQEDLQDLWPLRTRTPKMLQHAGESAF